MSTLMGEQESRVLESEEELYSYFQRFAKKTEEWRVGIEWELFGVERETGKALLYDGPRGIEAILCRLAATFHYEPLLENGRVIALKRGETWITLEPGAQVELSAPPVRSVVEIEEQITGFSRELREIEGYFPGVAWLSVGSHPFSSVEEIGWVPKERYRLMAEYFRTRGRLAHAMMKATATNQVSFDFPDEPSAMEQFRVVYAASSIASALFAHSPFSRGVPNGFLARRVAVWQETDSERCGLLLSFLEEGRSFRDYVEYLLEMPMIFIVRDGKWIPMGGISFRDFLQEGYQNYRATWGDFELHLSTAFPEARFKQYLEIRGIDAQPAELVPAVAAFWKGLLYDEGSRKRAVELLSRFKPEEHLRLYREIPRKGLKARLGGIPVLDLARELVHLSRKGLGQQRGSKGPEEEAYLTRLDEAVLKPGRSPAETLLERWEAGKRRETSDLVRLLEIGVR